AVLALNKSTGDARELDPMEDAISLKMRHKFDQSQAAANTQDVVRMKLLGANEEVSVSGQDQLPGKVNYFLGNDSEKWLTDIPTFAKVTYEGIYPGVDLVYYGNQRQLEYDFIIAPGVNPQAIQFSFEGTERIEIAETGELVLH